MDYAEFYRGIYRLFSRLTPIDADCGKLCRARCCRGGGEHGMILFPHEDELLAGAGFLKIERRELRGVACGFAVCGGRCVRALRPLSCRVFPLAPRLCGGAPDASPDPRARAICPLLGENQQNNIRPEFFEAVKLTAERLIILSETRVFLEVYTAMLADYEFFLG